MIGQIERISTDVAGDLVLKIVVPKEVVIPEIFKWLGEMVKIELRQEAAKEEL